MFRKHFGYFPYLRNIQSELFNFFTISKNLMRSTRCGDFTAVHHKNLIGPCHLVHMMSDKYYRHSFITVKLAYSFKYFPAADRVKHCRRFIKYDAFGLHRKHSRDCHSLLLSARELSGVLTRKFSHSDLIQSFVNPHSQLSLRYTEVFGTEGNILFNYRGYDLVIGILKDHASRPAYFQQLIIVLCIVARNVYLA